MLMHTPEADLRTEVALLRAQMEGQTKESHEIVPMASQVFVSSVMSCYVHYECANGSS